MPAPPRDLWARTATAIEREARHRALQPARRSPGSLAPYALLAGALAVAVVVGTLTSSQRSPAVTTATPAASNQIAVASAIAAPPRPTPLAVGPPGSRVRQPRAATATTRSIPRSDLRGLPRGRRPTASPAGAERGRKTSARCASPETVFGSGDAPLVVVGDSASRARSVFASRSRTRRRPRAEQPTESPTATAVQRARDERSAAIGRPIDDRSPTPPARSHPPRRSRARRRGHLGWRRDRHVASRSSIRPRPTRPTAPRSPSRLSLPTARSGPDIYLWTVGDATAHADHDRSSVGLRLVGRRR